MPKNVFKGEDGKEYIIKTKKPFYKRVWFIVLMIIIGLGFIGGLSSNDESKKNNNTKENQTEQSNKKVEKQIYRLNQDVQVGDVIYNIHNVEVSKSVGSTYSKIDAKGTFVIIDLTVTNKGNEAITVDSNFFTLLSADKKFESESMATITANQDSYNNDFFLDQVNPDLSIQGKVVFDVSEEVANSTDKQLQVQTGTFGTQKDIIQLQ